MSQKRALTRLAELLGVVGVIGSLVFVGVEVRQSAIATRAATDASIADAFRDLNQVIATSPELARALTTYQEDPGSAPVEDQVLIRALWRAVFHVWSNAHRQHLNGTIDPAIFASVIQEITSYAAAAPGASEADMVRRGRLMRWAWDKERFLFNPDFQLFVDSIIRPAPAP